jgi:succinylglutamic semialdehyde dehydrogenase
MSPTLPVFDRTGDYILGRFVIPRRPDAELRTYSPADLSQHVGTHPCALEHVELAVEAARTAQPAWRRAGESARRAVLERYKERLRAHRDDIAHTLALEVGKPLWEARTEADALVAKVDLALGEGARFTAEQRIADLPGEIRHRPLGVVAVIGPFNFPAHLPNGQIVPALLLGNAVVHKPSEKTPNTAVWLARCFHEAGLPPGVFNLVQGEAGCGQRLCTHPDVDGVLFTGSVAVGRRIVQDNAQRPDRLIALELGGKNATLALDDCDIERCARAVVFAAFATAGQRCSSTSRLIATRAVAEPLLARIVELTLRLRVGYPLGADDVFMGPVISESARASVLRAQAVAHDAGMEPLLRSAPLAIQGHRGHYLSPGVARAAVPSLEIDGYTDTELFGPDLAAYVVPDLDAALELANRSRFGLVAAVFTASADAFALAAEELKVGVVAWNRPTAGASSRLPFGGVKQSGNHRPAGILAGAACAYAQGIQLTAAEPGPLPIWPGIEL